MIDEWLGKRATSEGPQLVEGRLDLGPELTQVVHRTDRVGT